MGGDRQDIGLFAVVYAIFLAAFSVLIRGSMPLSYQHVRPAQTLLHSQCLACALACSVQSHAAGCVLRQCTGGPDDPEPYKCWDT